MFSQRQRRTDFLRVITSADVQFLAQNQVKTKKRSLRPQISGAPILRRGTTTGGAGLNPPPQPPTSFYGFHIKNTRSSTLFIKKQNAASAVTMDNAEIFSQVTVGLYV